MKKHILRDDFREPKGERDKNRAFCGRPLIMVGVTVPPKECTCVQCLLAYEMHMSDNGVDPDDFYK